MTREKKNHVIQSTIDDNAIDELVNGLYDGQGDWWSAGADDLIEAVAKYAVSECLLSCIAVEGTDGKCSVAIKKKFCL